MGKIIIFNWEHNFEYFASLNQITYYKGYGFINNKGEKQLNLQQGMI